MNYTCISDFGYLDSTRFLLLALHVITVFSTPIHFIGLSCLLLKTSERMKSIKWYLLIVQIWIITFDYSLSVLFVPYILFPAPAGYPLGYLSSIGIPAEYQALVLLISMAYFCTGILAVFEKRFYIVCAYQNTFWKWFRHFWLILHVLVVTGLYSSFLLFFPADQERLKEKVFMTLPCLPRYIYNAPIIVMTENYTYHFIVCTAFIIIYTIEGTILSGFVIWETIKQLKTRKMSSKAFQIQKSTTIALLTQMLVPLIMIITPCTYGWASLMVNYHNQALMNFAVITGSLHGALSTIVMVTVHRSYREAVQDVFKGSSRREETNDRRKYFFVVINH